MNKFMTAADMVAQLKSGMTIGVGGNLKYRSKASS